MWIVQRRPGRRPGFLVTAQTFPDRIEVGIEGDDYRVGDRPVVWDPAGTLAPAGLGILIARKMVSRIDVQADGRYIHLTKQIGS